MKNTLNKICGIIMFTALCLPVCAGGRKDRNGTEVKSEDGTEISVEKNDFSAERTQINTPAEQATLRVGILNGPTAIPVAHILDGNMKMGAEVLSFEKFASPTALLPKMLKGEIDIGFLPANIAAKTYNSAAGAVLCAGISCNGNLYLITKVESTRSFGDLLGKKVTVAGQGATPEYMFRWLLEQNNVPSGTGDNAVTLDFSIPTANIAAELLTGRTLYAVVPEPFATVAVMKNGGVRRAIDFQEAYGEIEGKEKTYPLTVMVVAKNFAQTKPDAVRAFIEMYKDSLDWTEKHPQKAGVSVQKHTLGLMAPVVANAIPYCNFVWEDSDKGRLSIEKMLSVFMKFAPESVGGKLPDSGFYFK